VEYYFQQTLTTTPTNGCLKSELVACVH